MGFSQVVAGGARSAAEACCCSFGLSSHATYQGWSSWSGALWGSGDTWREEGSGWHAGTERGACIVRVGVG